VRLSRRSIASTRQWRSRVPASNSPMPCAWEEKIQRRAPLSPASLRRFRFLGFLTVSPVFVITRAVYSIQALLNFTRAWILVAFLALSLLHSLVPGPIGAALDGQARNDGQKKEPARWVSHSCPLLLAPEYAAAWACGCARSSLHRRCFPGRRKAQTGEPSRPPQGITSVNPGVKRSGLART